MMSGFYDAVTQHGLPDQIRSDCGGENVDVWRFQHQSESAVIVRSSTHNQWIERLWRDVHRCVSVLYADLFRTEHNLTPNQLFIQGAPSQNMTPAPPRQSAGPTSPSGVVHPTVTSTIQVPRSSFTPCDNLVQDIEQLIVPSQVTDDFNYSVFKRLSRFVGHHIQGCVDCVIKFCCLFMKTAIIIIILATWGKT